MKDILSKLTSYDIFNNLLPGVILLVAFRESEIAKLGLANLAIGAFIAYTAGMMCSRIGSLLVAGILDSIQSKLKLRRNYKDYVRASKLDEDILVFNEKNNTYRTLIACFLCIAAGKAILADYTNFKWTEIFNQTTFFLLFSIILFTVSYFKQTAYISKRIDIANSQDLK